jgi:cytochrome c oxidase assembly protein Cox11
VAQEVEQLLCMCEVLSLNSSPIEKQKSNQNKNIVIHREINLEGHAKTRMVQVFAFSSMTSTFLQCGSLKLKCIHMASTKESDTLGVNIS